MVTVGAVGVVYTQFQSLVGNPSEAVGSQQEIRNTNMKFTSVYNNDSGNLVAQVSNTGSVAWNSSQFTMRFIPGGEGRSVTWNVANERFSGSSGDFSCFSDGDSYEVVQPGDTYVCDTGFDFPSSTETIGLEIEMNGASKMMDSHTCSPQTEDALGC
jgi:hypothetical protein